MFEAWTIAMTPARMFAPGLAMAFQTAWLGFEAQNVMALRCLRLAAGGMANQAEATRMVSEKIAAFAEAQLKSGVAIAAGRSPRVVAGKVLRTYSKRVRANRRRLTRR